VARWLLHAGRAEEALAMLRRAFHQGLPESPHVPHHARHRLLEKKLGNEQASVAMVHRPRRQSNAFQARAFEELAKFYEHHERNYAMALEMTRSAQALAASPEIDARVERSALRSPNAPAAQPTPPHHRAITA